MRPPRLRLRAACAALALTFGRTIGADAQDSVSARSDVRTSLRGRIVDRRTGQPVANARVYVSGLRDTLRASSDGSFTTDRAALGAHVVEVTAIGYSPTRWLLELGQAAFDMLFEIEPSLPVLDTINVPAAARPILDTNDWRSPQAIERRRRHGGGQFLTYEQIRHSHARTLAELLPLIPGVMVQCSNRNCAVLMTAAMHACPVDYYLDGAPATFSTGPSFPVSGIRALEVYRPSEVPIEFARPNSTCGIIAIWTKMER